MLLPHIKIMLHTMAQLIMLRSMAQLMIMLRSMAQLMIILHSMAQLMIMFLAWHS